MMTSQKTTRTMNSLCEPRELAIDIESYSSVELKDCGAYKYAASPDFEILLIAYKFSDEDDVKLIDCREELIEGADLAFAHPEFYDALVDPAIIKTAYNANFERTCFAAWLQEEMPPTQWLDTMVLAASLGLPRSLAAVGDALGLGEDEAKLRTGKALINYFCKPCRPTKVNGGRTRNYPEDAPEKWEQFKTYNVQDVVTEQAILQRLKQWRPDASENALWALDQKINDRGVRLDIPMAEVVVEHDTELRDRLKQRAVVVSCLDNPNSLQQLTGWLDSYGIHVDSLAKDTVARLLSQELPAPVREVLTIRQSLGKTSVKKYQTMINMAGADDRARGTLMFYGGHTGRWCLTGDHEVLTETGWVRLDAWTGGPIACWNSSTEAITFQKAKPLCFDYAGQLYHYEDTRIDQISTPEHKMPIRKRYTTEWTPLTVEEMSKRGRPGIPFTGRRNTTPGLDHTALRILVMTQADGYYGDDLGLRFHFKKQRKIERCKMLLRKAGIPYTERAYSDGTTHIVIPQRKLPLYLRMFREKTFGMWLLDENADVFFDELLHWDGYRAGPNSIQYVTNNKVNADIVQAFAHTSGRAANIKVKKRPGWNDSYYISIWLTPNDAHEIIKKPITTHYEGKVYCAETKTGYFLVRRNGKCWITGNSGKGLQPQNLSKNEMPDEELDLAHDLVKAGDFESVEMIWGAGTTSDILSQLVRTAFIPSEGCRFVVSDFSAIEARVIAWLAGEQWRLDVFENGGDIYCASASQMFGVPVEKNGINGHMRKQGKIAELALGYGGSVGAIDNFDRGGSIPEEDRPDLVKKWRAASPNITALWNALEKAAIRCVRTRMPVELPQYYGIRFRFERAHGYNVLFIDLPNGRPIAYWDPKIKTNKFDKSALSFMHVATGKWVRGDTFGGRITENVIQSIARDCLAEKMKTLDEFGYNIAFHVHDEVILDVPTEDTGAAALVDQIMGEPISWAPGLPLKGGTYECNYYRKD